MTLNYETRKYKNDLAVRGGRLSLLVKKFAMYSVSSVYALQKTSCTIHVNVRFTTGLQNISSFSILNCCL